MEELGGRLYSIPASARLRDSRPYDHLGRGCGIRAQPQSDQRNVEEREQDRFLGSVDGLFRKIDGNWLIVHDQVSVPIDIESGKALLNLQP